MQANRNTRLKRILEEIKEEDAEADVREKMQMLSSQLIDSISNLHQVFSNRIFIAISRGFWDRMGQVRNSMTTKRKTYCHFSWHFFLILTGEKRLFIFLLISFSGITLLLSPNY